MPAAGSNPDSSQTVAVVGCGVIGMPTALLLAHAGHKVIGVDINERVIERINNWDFALEEPEMQQVIADETTKAGFLGSLEMPKADVYIIAAPTPLQERKKVCDMGAVESALQNVIPQLEKGNLIILESTVPPLTTKEFAAPMLKDAGFEPGVDIHIAFCPERVLPGHEYRELVHNDRVIGGLTPECAELARRLYATFVKGKLVVTDATTAELCKLTENAYRDVCIAFANDMSLVAESLDVDVDELISLANRHPRVDILRPGVGVGGHCLPIDPYFIGEADPFHTRMILAARRVNDEMPGHTARRIRIQLKDIENPRILGFGLAYKPDTPDMRESPAVEVWELLKEQGMDCSVYDPMIEGHEYGDFAALLENIDALIVMVRHSRVMHDIEQHEGLIAEKGIRVLLFG